ncbi:MAG: ammonium transporter [Acholeplasmatales bacterium]|nr:ammonium transporter [Acholeplasmatales bacterium]
MDFGIWFLIGAALVFFMQAGFAMVETGFTRAKNAGNIIMKNLMDFCIGTFAFSILGAGLMLGEDKLAGLVGLPNLGMWNDFANYDWSSFVFNLVFCATASTIVSGAVAERTKFSSYCIYSLIISLVIYPIEAHWVWGGGWLSQHGFIDFAGSACIHSVGGLCALIGAIMIGARTGKYIRDDAGKVVKVNAIQGHSLTLGALGCFILWFGWYGFNGAAAQSLTELAQIFATTTVAPAFATVACLILTWVKNGKPDVSMCLNASLAGLVAITAGCQAVDYIGAAIIGIVSGILVDVAVEVIDKKFHVDDPVGAIGVHFVNGVFGTIAAGLFATSKSALGVDGPIYALIHGTSFVDGLQVLGWQFLGIFCILLWTGATITLTFFVLKKTVGLRASVEDEIKGMDLSEHGIVAYADFVPQVESIDYTGAIQVIGEVPEAEAVEVKKMDIATEVDVPSSLPQTNLHKVEIICKENMLDALKNAMNSIGVSGMTVTHVMGCGVERGRQEFYRGVAVEVTLLPKVQVEMVVSTVPVEKIVDTAKRTLYTGHIGDGKIFVYDVRNAIKVRTGEEGSAALQDAK